MQDISAYARWDIRTLDFTSVPLIAIIIWDCRRRLKNRTAFLVFSRIVPGCTTRRTSWFLPSPFGIGGPMGFLPWSNGIYIDTPNTGTRPWRGLALLLFPTNCFPRLVRNCPQIQEVIRTLIATRLLYLSACYATLLSPDSTLSC